MLLFFFLFLFLLFSFLRIFLKDLKENNNEFEEFGKNNEHVFFVFVFFFTAYSNVKTKLLILNFISADYTERPKKLLIFVDTACENGNAMQIFRKKVQPLFELAKVNYETVGKFIFFIFLMLHSWTQPKKLA